MPIRFLLTNGHLDDLMHRLIGTVYENRSSYVNKGVQDFLFLKKEINRDTPFIVALMQ